MSAHIWGYVMRKLIFIFLLGLSINSFAETKSDGTYIAPNSVRGLCGELEKSIVSYNKAWVEANMLWADAFNKQKNNEIKFQSNNSDLVKKSLDDSVERWNKLDCTSIIYSKNK
jgi:hypothetical protein